ncbi:hypothetical protein IAU59_000924 [Kwoniella sp. CBS 9459]
MSATPALAVPPLSSPSRQASPETASSTSTSALATADASGQVPSVDPAPVDSNGGTRDIQALKRAAMQSARGKRAKSAPASRAASPSTSASETVLAAPSYPPTAEAGPSSKPISSHTSPSSASQAALSKPPLPFAPHLPHKPIVLSTKITAVQLGKEEGEISDDDEPGEMKESDALSRSSERSRPGPPSRSQGRRDSRSPVRPPSTRGRGGKKQQQQQPRRTSLIDQTLPIRTSALPPKPLTRKTVAKGKGKEAPAAPGDTVASAAADISPEEAKQYMDIIRNLIFEGFSPETLVERGATPKYVMAVCEEIVEGTKKRQALWSETREQVRADSETPSVAPTVVPPTEEGKSPSPDVEVSIKPGLGPDMERVKSYSSESSAEHILVERMSPPEHMPVKPSSSTSWTPAEPDRLSDNRAGPSSAHPVKIESYKPDTLTVSNLPKPLPPSAPRSERYGAYVSSQQQLASRITVTPQSSSFSAPHQAPTSNPIENQYQQRKGKRRPGKAWDSGLSIGSDVVLNYGDEEEPPPSASLPARPTLPEGLKSPTLQADIAPPTSTPPPLPVDLPPPDIPELPVIAVETSIPSVPAPSAAETALQNALLESRRKVLESMRRRRAALDNNPPQAVAPEPVVEQSNLVPETHAAMALSQSIEEQMADIEREVMSLQAENQIQDTGADEDEDMLVDMDIDEPEEGEILSSNLPTPPSEPIVTLPTLPASAPVPRPPRGVKRLHAEDLMENRSTSAPSRIPPPQKRRLFGAIQRPQRLIIHLDDSSDSSDDDDDAIPIPPPDPDILATQRLLAEKEESIRRLKEQIAAKMRARQKKKLEGNSAEPGGSPITRAPSGEGILSIRTVAELSGPTSGDQSPLPADVRELKQELVQAEAEVEAMDPNTATLVFGWYSALKLPSVLT